MFYLRMFDYWYFDNCFELIFYCGFVFRLCCFTLFVLLGCLVCFRLVYWLMVACCALILILICCLIDSFNLYFDLLFEYFDFVLMGLLSWWVVIYFVLFIWFSLLAYFYLLSLKRLLLFCCIWIFLVFACFLRFL